MMLLEIRQLQKTYHQKGSVETPALRGIDLNVAPGEFLVISGPSGSGKTTLLNIIGGLDEPSSGGVWLNGRNIVGLGEEELAEIRLREIGFIFQAYNLIPVFSARENIEYVLALQKVGAVERRQRVDQLAGALDIEGLLAKKPREMSGGQQQRVAVARAMVSRPRLILADEPTANLDTENGEKLMDLMRRMNEEFATTFVISSHDPVVIERARRNIVLKDGRIDQDSS